MTNTTSCSVCSEHRWPSSRARSLGSAHRGSRHYCRWPYAAVNRSHAPLARPASRAQGLGSVYGNMAQRRVVTGKTYLS